MNNKQDSRILHSKAWIREAFLQLLSEQPFEDITIKQITQKAGVSRQTFYAHYGQKEEVLGECIDLFFYELSLQIQNTTDLESLSSSLVMHLQEHEPFLRTLFQSNLDLFILRKLESFLSQVWLIPLMQARKYHSIIRDNDLVTFLAAGCFFTGKKIVSTKDPIDLDYYCKVLFSILHTLLQA
ncbi:MAG: TetR/AcrR family transcriptional regulator [Niameybacter sp.]|uniref:TetR/AcrR family transcriptional regulator n=1 Tax=Niameybacter sp. TaxID=2033640 RepID=UPI002FC6C696